jgi:hypothetical protein
MPSHTNCRRSPEPAPFGADGTEPVFCLSLRSLPEVGIVARVVQQLSRLDLLPHSWHITDGGPHLLMDLQVADLSVSEGELLAEAMRRIVGVEEVLTARTKRRTAA